MQKILSLTVSFLISLLTFAQCPSGPITLNSQADVDIFAANFPGCTSFDFDLTISGGDITDLSGLSEITAMSRRLIIVNNPNLTSLSGLSPINFSSLNASIEIEDNLLLTSVTDLVPTSIQGMSITLKNNPLVNSISSFSGMAGSGYIEIDNCDSLVNLSGLEGIAECDVLFLYNNELLEDISALGNISGDASNIEVVSNPALTNLDGLEGYANCYLDLYIYDNASLLNLDGLSGITNSAAAPNSVNLIVSDNVALTDISGLAGLDFDSVNTLEITGNTSLSICNFLNICNYFATGGGFDVIENNAPGCNSIPEIISSCGLDLNVISGTIKFDFNVNGCDPADFDAESILVEITDGINSYSTISNNNGEYLRFFDVDGTFTTHVVASSLPQFFSASPSSVITSFTGLGNQEVIDFCLTASQVFDDLKVVQIPLNDARPGFEADYQIVYQNIGTTLHSDEIIMTYQDNRQSFLSANPAPDNISGNQLSWNYNNLLPFESRVINLTFDTFPPPINEAGDDLGFETQIYPIAGDANTADNTYELKQTIVNSQDPNDKLVLQGPQILEEQVGEYLDYVVRFQNVGTADAINVRVDDVLSDNLDWNSLRILSVSHDFVIEILNGNMLSFVFDNINLPPVTTDPEGSNGFVAFQVRSLNTLVIGDEIENAANIFFDFNDPIITNTVVTEIVEELSVDDFIRTNDVIIYPNPFSESLTVFVSNEVIFKKAEIFSILGEMLKVSSSKILEVDTLSEGIYFVHISTNRGSVIRKIVKE